MSNIILKPNESGTGNITIETPNTNTDRTLNIPDTTGNIVTTGDTGSVTNGMISDGAVTSAKLGSTLDLTGNTIISPVLRGKDNSGNVISSPQFSAYIGWGSFSHTFSVSTATSSFTSTSGRACWPRWNAVDGNNVSGFVTSNSTSLESYYEIPMDGIYQFSFSVLMNANATSHVDGSFFVSSEGASYNGLNTWDPQYIGNKNEADRPCGFYRLYPNNIPSTPGCSIVARFYQGQRVRPMVGMNVNFTGQIYGSNGGHGYFQGAYLGALENGS